MVLPLPILRASNYVLIDYTLRDLTTLADGVTTISIPSMPGVPAHRPVLLEFSQAFSTNVCKRYATIAFVHLYLLRSKSFGTVKSTMAKVEIYVRQFTPIRLYASPLEKVGATHRCFCVLRRLRFWNIVEPFAKNDRRKRLTGPKAGKRSTGVSKSSTTSGDGSTDQTESMTTSGSIDEHETRSTEGSQTGTPWNIGVPTRSAVFREAAIAGQEISSKSRHE
ncbi:hypothetical protein KM043_012221 [Ampulex compressa]|nr:hypothetical protein KM043_012221 [Ampulex compressa]